MNYKSALLCLTVILVGACADKPQSSTQIHRGDPGQDESPIKTVNRFGKQLKITLDCGQKDCAKDYAPSVRALGHYFQQFAVNGARFSKILFYTGGGQTSFDGQSRELVLPAPFDDSRLHSFFQELGLIVAAEGVLGPKISYSSLEFTSTVIGPSLRALTINQAKINACGTKLAWIIFSGGPSSFNGGFWSVSPQEVETNFDTAFSVVTCK